MLKTLSFAGAALAVGASALVPVAPAMAQRGYYGDRGYGYDRQYNDRQYDSRGDYGYRGQSYRSNRGRCNSDGGTIIGAIAGGLLGHTVVSRGGDHLLGTVIGAGAGALAGRAIDRSGQPGYCRR